MLQLLLVRRSRSVFPQVFCYEDSKLLKLFSDIVRILYDHDVIAEDTIMWCAGGFHTVALLGLSQAVLAEGGGAAVFTCMWFPQQYPLTAVPLAGQDIILDPR